MQTNEHLNGKMRKGFFFGMLVLFLTGSRFLYAQKSADLIRLEIPSAIAPGSYGLASLSDGGLMIFYQGRGLTEQKKRKWYFGLFDTSLRQRWLKEVPLTNKLQLVGHRLHNGKLVFLFKNLDKIKRGPGYYEILIYDLKSQVFTEINGKLPSRTGIVDYKLSGQWLCMALKRPGFISDLLFVNTKSGAIKVAHLNAGGQTDLAGLFVDRQNGHFIVVVNRMNVDSVFHHKIFNFSQDARVFGKIDVINKDHLRYLKTFALAEADGMSMKFFGVYNQVELGKKKSHSYDNYTKPQSAGFFYLNIENGAQRVLRFYDFMQFKNITGTYANSQIQYHRKRKKLRNILSDTSVNAVSLLNLGKLQLYSYQDQYVVAAEAYTPYYKTETRVDYDFYGNPYPSTYQVFGGYNYYDLILAGFDADGSMVWDNDFPMKGLLSSTNEQKSSVYIDTAQINLAYVNNGQIFTQDINGPVDLDKLEKVSIVSRFKRDKSVESTESHILYWYKKYFLVYGYQKMRNRSLNDKSIRTIFYVNKLAFE